LDKQQKISAQKKQNTATKIIIKSVAKGPDSMKQKMEGTSYKIKKKMAETSADEPHYRIKKRKSHPNGKKLNIPERKYHKNRAPANREGSGSEKRKANVPHRALKKEGKSRGDHAKREGTVGKKTWFPVGNVRKERGKSQEAGVLVKMKASGEGGTRTGQRRGERAGGKGIGKDTRYPFGEGRSWTK